MDSPEFVDYICKKDLTLAQRIWKAIKNLINKLRNVNNTDAENNIKKLTEFQEMLGDEILKYKSQKNSSKNDTDIKFSIEYASDGSKVVVINTDQGIFLNEKPSDYSSIVKKYINEKYKGITLPLSENNSAHINNKTAGEYSYPRKYIEKQSNEYSAKMKVSTELENLLETSQYAYSQKDVKDHNFATMGFDYYNVDFICDGRQFTGLINIGVSEKGNTFYDITKIKEVPNISDKYVALMAKLPSHFGNFLNNTNISQSDNDVKHSIHENSENDTKNNKNIAEENKNDTKKNKKDTCVHTFFSFFLDK